MTTETSLSAPKQLYLDVCMLCADIDAMEITAGNKEQVRNTIIQRLEALTFVEPYEITDVYPDADAPLKAEIDQMRERLNALKQQLEAHLAAG